MTALNALPVYVQGILAFIAATWLFYVFKLGLTQQRLKKKGKIALYAVVLWLYGMSLIGLLDYLGVDKDVMWFIFLAINALSLILFVSGVYITYTKGPESNKEVWKSTFKSILKVIIFGFLAMLLVAILGRLGIIS